MISRYDIAMRTIVDIPEPQIRALDALTRIDGVSRAELVRRAVALYLRRHAKLSDDAFGSWTGIADGLAYQRRLRDEW
jgi:metal-responsive CopG/Arc/MetJ family transcriptional regulator